jgi:hypothetical protein
VSKVFEIELANEYALVTVRAVNTANGSRLEIVSPRLGKSIRLDPVELEALTWQSHEMFSELLQTPYGPEREGEG